MSNIPLWLQCCYGIAVVIGGAWAARDIARGKNLLMALIRRMERKHSYRETILAEKPVAFYPLDEEKHD